MTRKSQRAPAGFASAGLPWPRERHRKARSWFLKSELLGNIYLIFFYFIYFLLHPFQAALLPFLDLKHDLAQRFLRRNFSLFFFFFP